MAGNDSVSPCSVLFPITFIGRDHRVVEILKLADRVAATNTPVFIYGESGTGKEHLARYIHCHSNRRHMPLVKIDCATIPPDLVESELFGHERGAFTGAVESKPGKFERGDGGTILLDSITNLETNTQAKLTRVIQERSFERLGGIDPIHIDARYIACSNSNPSLAIAKGFLRKELYYRLGVICIELPPLRKRQSDIPLLIEHFIKTLPAAAHRPNLLVEPEALEYLKNAHWPGNIRQLINVLERTLITCENTSIGAQDIQLTHINLQEELLFSAIQEDLTLEEMEKHYIQAILHKTNGNKSKAAEILGIHRKTLLEKRKKYGLL